MAEFLLSSTLRIPSSHILPLAVFLGYFVLIGYLLHVVLRATLLTSSPFLDAKGASRRTGWAAVFGLIGLGSLVHTWYHMIKYMIWSHSNAISLLSPVFPARPLLLSITTWLHVTKLFEQAWSIVLQPGPTAWISSHITSFTVNWVLFLWLSVEDGDRSAPLAVRTPQDKEELVLEKIEKKDVVFRPERNWGRYEAACVILLGQVVAVSFAASLWFLGCVRRGKSSAQTSGAQTQRAYKEGVPRRVWIPLVLASISASVIPLTVNAPTFLPNLLLLHALLLLPFFITPPPSPSPNEIWVGSLFLSAILPLPTFYFPILLNYLFPLHISLDPRLYLPGDVWRTYRTSNHAVRSISADVAWCTVATVVWAWYTGRFFLTVMNRGEKGWWARLRFEGARAVETLGSVWMMWNFGSPGIL